MSSAQRTSPFLGLALACALAKGADTQRPEIARARAFVGAK